MGIDKCFSCELNHEDYCLCDYPRNKFLISATWHTEDCPWYKKKED